MSIRLAVTVVASILVMHMANARQPDHSTSPTAAPVALATAATRPTGMDAFAKRLMKAFGVPGMAVVTVVNGEVQMHAYGVRKLGSPDRVDAHTTFPIGSVTKSFTSTALGILVDEAKLHWNDSVVDRLPGFRMYDAYASQNITVKDLLVHRSGLSLGEGDLMFLPDTNRTRAELVHSIRYLKPATSFRNEFAYDNVLYSVAGEVVQAVSGQTWESFVKQHIFGPLRMRDATVSFADQGPDHATPHARTSEAIRGMGPLAPLASDGVSEPIAPAGGICASADDMGRWLSVQLAGGMMPDGKRLFSAVQAKMLWTPVTVIPIEPAPQPIVQTTPDFREYALGFGVTDYRGHKIVTHAGGVLGGLADMVFIPEKHIAFAFMINSENIEAILALHYHLLDHFLGLPPANWIPRFQQVEKARLASALKTLQSQQQQMHPDRGPSLPLRAYAGVYRDPWYGTMTISERLGKLHVSFDRSPGMEGSLVHAQYDTFRTRWTDRNIVNAYVTFELDPFGKIVATRMRRISPIADFSWDYQDLHFVPEPQGRAAPH